MRARLLVSCCTVLLIAELASSFSVWSGTPTDWVGEPLRFWTYEMRRLQSWGIFLLLASLVWVTGWYVMHRRAPRVALGLFGAVLATAIEALTSTRFWRQLSWTESACLGWSYFPRYFQEHLTAWAIVLLLGLAVVYHRERRGKSAPQPRTRDA